MAAITNNIITAVSGGPTSVGGRRSKITAPDVFISHSKEDADFAELLKVRLHKHHLDAWIDEDRLRPGIDWQREIDIGIRRSKVVLAVMTPDAKQSDYVTYEWAYALGTGKTVIPIMLKQTAMHPRLSTLHFLDFTNRIGRPWKRLLYEVNRLCHVTLQP